MQVSMFHEYVWSVDGEKYWSLAEQSGSAHREFYTNHNHEAYTRFAQSCQEWADLRDIPYLEASNKIHAMFNINPSVMQ